MKRLIANQFDDELEKYRTNVQDGSETAKCIQLGEELIKELNIEPQSNEWYKLMRGDLHDYYWYDSLGRVKSRIK